MKKNNMTLNNILFLDIETVAQYPTYDQVPDNWKPMWNKKADVLLRNRENETAESIYGHAAIFAEFGKIICITVGLITGKGDDRKLSIKSFSGDDEVSILKEFTEMLQRWATDDNKFLCAHNGREFDYPYLCRRMLINKIPIPAILNIAGKKPWEVKHLDTMDMWKFGDYKSYTSLELMALALGIPTPKDDIDGSMVGEIYWQEKNLMRIVAYCQKDVITTVQVYLRMQNLTPIPATHIEIK